MAQHNQTLRKSLRSALAHKKLADSLMDSLAEMQTKFNAAMAKLDADSPTAVDTDFVATCALSGSYTISPDAPGTGAQHKATPRKSLRSALAHKRAADAWIDSMASLQSSFSALLVKLDAQAGTLTDTDFAATLDVTAVDFDAPGTGAQHKATLRKSIRSALAHRKLGDTVSDSISGMQASMNAAMANLDAGNITGVMAPLEVSVVNPDAP